MEQPKYRVVRVSPLLPETKAMVSKLHDAVFPAGTWTARPRLNRYGYVWIVFDIATGEPVAFAELSPSYRWDKTGYLSRSGVLEEHRGNGLQKVLIKKRVAYAKKLGWHTVLTDTIHNNAPSINSLISCGFKSYLPLFPWGSKDIAVYWRKRL